jgi:TonB family protein
MANSLPLWDFSPDVREIVESLKARIAEGTEEIDSILRQVAETAQVLTGANGSAIAIRSGEEILCRARSGDTAPPLGSRLDAASGISGECLLTGAVLCCNDTAVNPRVDPEVCRLLQLRSVAVLPVRGRDEIAGILEVFSTHTDAFTAEHIVSLKWLAGLVESACASSSVEGFTAIASQQSHLGPELDSGGAIGAQAAPLPPIESQSALVVNDRRGYWVAGSAAAAILLIAFVALRTFHTSAKPEALGRQGGAQIVSQPGSAGPSPSAESVTQSGESLNGNRRREPSAGEERGLQRASQVDVVSRAGRLASVKSASLPPAVPAGRRLPAFGHDLNYNHVPAPPPLAGTDPASQAALLLPAATLPKLALPISQGISGGVLEHQVKPIYPSAAIALSLEGAVVLQATVTKAGDVRDARLLRGDPILGQAALVALKQWHYQPYRLDGQPVEMQTEITVQFKAK